MSTRLAPTAEQAAPKRGRRRIRRGPQPATSDRSFRRDDGLALAALVVVLAVIGLNRVWFDAWISRYDLYTFFVPWYAFLGERLRELAIPGWNPYLFSGTPFAADPESGWMYLPAMAAFTLFEVLAGFKALLLIHVAVAGLSTYAFARVLGLGAVAALAAAVTFSVGPVLQWTSWCCLVLIQYAVWVPLALLGIELAIAPNGHPAGTWRQRLLPWFLTGFALSQILAGWVGQGWLVGPILIAAYTGYRTLIDPPDAGVGFRDRLALCLATGIGTIGSGLALGAAGVLPRLVYNGESNLAGGYLALGASGADKPAWTLSQLAHQVLAEGYGQRMSALGGAVVVLAVLAPVIAGRRHGVPFFAILTLVSLVLTLDPTPLHQLFYLIPRFQEMHQHDPWRSYALGIIGPALLCGATIQELPRWRGRVGLLPVLTAPLLLMGLAAIAIREQEGFIGWRPLIAAAVTVVLLAGYVAVPGGRPATDLIRNPGARFGRRTALTPSHRPQGHPANRGSGEQTSMPNQVSGSRLTRAIPIALLVVILIQPTGLELAGSWLGFPNEESWQEHWELDPPRMQALRDEIRPVDPGGAGEFLQTRLAGFGPFRYLGYGGAGYAEDEWSSSNYMGRRLEPNIRALLVNGRAMFLELYDTQGYNPLELGRYSDFMTAVNGTPQDYHLAYLLPGGVGSPLLDLLNLRYVVVDATLPTDRDDMVALTNGSPAVFEAEYVTVYERQPVPRHAWVVHDVRSVARGEALPLMTNGTIDFAQTALVEGDAPELGPVPAGATESAIVTRYEPDRLTVATTTAAPGLLVLSEIYAAGWHATVDGQAAELLPTNHALRGIPLPAGEHVVELRYEPVSLRVGLAISLVAYVGFGVVIVLAIRRSRRHHRPSGSRRPTFEW